jgi:hypothetical protein
MLLVLHFGGWILTVKDDPDNYSRSALLPVEGTVDQGAARGDLEKY